MSARYTQSKSEAQRHTEILKAMLKRPENKLCADCKRNDPRWASTNLGCFMCIRCSGVHRGMGVHISRIKSVDLDTWSPQQIDNIQRWGNRRSNAYWEAHLKPGHSPPEHKVESFIRSKYESKRWALEGPLPEDPEMLDNEDRDGGLGMPSSNSPNASTTTAPPVRSTSRTTTASSTRKAPSTTAIDLLAGPPPPSSGPSSTSASASRAARSPILQAENSQASTRATAPTASSGAAGGGLLDLDFNATAQAPAVTQPKRDAKADILSLFAAAPLPSTISQGGQQQYHQSQSQSQAQAQRNSGQFGGGGGLVGGLAGLNMNSNSSNSTTDPWGSSNFSSANPSSTSTGGGGGGGSGFGGFDAFAGVTSNASDSFRHNQSGQHQQQPHKVDNAFGTVPVAANVWGSAAPVATVSNGVGHSDLFGDFSGAGGSSSSSSNFTSSMAASGTKQKDSFSDIWG